MIRIKIDQIDAKYQAYARSIDSPEARAENGACDYKKSEKLYNNKKNAFLANNNLQSNDTSLIATYGDGIIEGWEYKMLYKKVRADVEQEIAKKNFYGESLFDSVFGTNTVNNKKESLISQLIHKYLGV